MKVADLYIRVSTDEQAEKGYSQRDQEERLRKYCQINRIHVRNVLYEDHSAKTFNRPEWKKLLVILKKNQGKSDLVLFTKWDRFSRNTSDAYQMISVLRRVGVEPQAVEQPLDLSIPENKMMLAFYLATPEVENDRRALNVFHGMRRAKKEGRWMATAPVGYINRSTEDGLKYIAPNPPVSEIMTWAFNELSKGVLNTQQVWEGARRKGLKSSKNAFWCAIRNPVYCGKIFIPKYKDEEGRLVQGKHQPLISESLFYQVQDVLDGRKKAPGTKYTVDDEIHLRGFLICPKCERKLTGSASKGRNRHYHYYHCTPQCGSRFKSELVNDAMISEINKYTFSFPNLELYRNVITSVYQSVSAADRIDKQRVKEELKMANDRIVKARELLITGDLEPDDYRIIKSESTDKINRLEGQLSELTQNNSNIESLWDKAIGSLCGLAKVYEKGTADQRRKIVGSMFPENLTFNGFGFRTKRVNEVARVMCLISSQLEGQKKGTSHSDFDLSREVTEAGLEPAQLAPYAPQTYVYTNFTTRPFALLACNGGANIGKNLFNCTNSVHNFYNSTLCIVIF